MSSLEARRDRGYLDPDSGHLAKSFQKRVQKLSGLSKAPLFREELEYFSFHFRLFLCRPHFVSELPGTAHYEEPDAQQC